MSLKPTILLSSTINPNEIFKIGRMNPIDREDDYFKATEFYLKRGFLVVFVDNSDTKSEKILSLGHKFSNLEYLSFVSLQSHLGKSKGEVEIINFALENSQLLKSVDYIIKISGRYLISNLEEVLSPTNHIEMPVYVNPTRNLRWADTRLMMMKKSFYHHYFLPTATEFLDETKKVFMENVFMKSVLKFVLDGGELHLWPTYPCYQGYDGTHNEPVTFSFVKSWRYKIYYRMKKFVFKHRA